MAEREPPQAVPRAPRSAPRFRRAAERRSQPDPPNRPDRRPIAVRQPGSAAKSKPIAFAPSLARRRSAVHSQGAPSDGHLSDPLADCPRGTGAPPHVQCPLRRSFLDGWPAALLATGGVSRLGIFFDRPCIGSV